jgi:hypothetical protein
MLQEANSVPYTGIMPALNRFSRCNKLNTLVKILNAAKEYNRAKSRVLSPFMLSLIAEFFHIRTIICIRPHSFYSLVASRECLRKEKIDKKEFLQAERQKEGQEPE